MTQEQILYNYLEWFIPQLFRLVNLDEVIDYRAKPGGSLVYVRVYHPDIKYQDPSILVFVSMVEDVWKFFPYVHSETIKEITIKIISSIEISHKHARYLSNDTFDIFLPLDFTYVFPTFVINV